MKAQPMPNNKSNQLSLEELTSFAKRRGFVFQASEIYGGLAGFWDLGPYGVELVHNITASWWRHFVNKQPNVVGLDTTIVQHPKLWVASGHVDTFVDPMVDCRNCQHRFRADHVADLDTTDLTKLKAALADKACPNCGEKALTEPRQFNMMFKTHVGPVEDSGSTTYLRPETAGGIFAQYDSVRETTRSKLPFGIAQIGKAFRNEITPGDFIFRLRELTQMELEMFVKPEAAEAAYADWKQYCMEWLHTLGLKSEHLRFHDHADDERAHYAAASVDIQFLYPAGFKELYGIANRTDYDLKAHSKNSGRDLSYFDEDTKARYTPYVIEPSVGAERLLMAILLDAYDEETVNDDTRVVMRFTPDMAPIKVAILPLSKKPELSSLAREIFSTIAGEWRVEYDETQSIGRRYRRQDEIGTPLCVTIDFDSLEDKAVTVRDRDSMQQTRIAIADLPDYIRDKLGTKA